MRTTWRPSPRARCARDHRVPGAAGLDVVVDHAGDGDRVTRALAPASSDPRTGSNRVDAIVELDADGMTIRGAPGAGDRAATLLAAIAAKPAAALSHLRGAGSGGRDAGAVPRRCR